MKDKCLQFSEVNDVFAFRIIVKNVDTCYRVLGVIHNLYKPVPGQIQRLYCHTEKECLSIFAYNIVWT